MCCSGKAQYLQSSRVPGKSRIVVSVIERTTWWWKRLRATDRPMVLFRRWINLVITTLRYPLPIYVLLVLFRRPSARPLIDLGHRSASSYTPSSSLSLAGVVVVVVVSIDGVGASESVVITSSWYEQARRCGCVRQIFSQKPLQLGGGQRVIAPRRTTTIAADSSQESPEEGGEICCLATSVQPEVMGNRAGKSHPSRAERQPIRGGYLQAPITRHSR
ncbi:unnamed protein product [Soboliphyme baturini]|uniref:Uncharacterized protein n=1 Tax=Soboliphyme baturini TaxID=241478 RepID=A0A183IM74_9BILA|nr:unnamed protein product [Soboliphyme baturini]